MINLKKFIYNKSKMLNLFQIIGGYSLQPFFLLVHLTLACNLRCDNCYQLNDEFYSPLKNFNIKPDDFEKILKEARVFLIKPQIHFFGGEPLLNPHFLGLLNLADQYGFKSSITTNGILLNKYAENILNSDLNQINVSINNVKEKCHSEGNLPGIFDKIITAIWHLKQKSNKGPGKKIVNINCVISESNQNRLVDITKYFIDNNIDIDVLAFQHPYFPSSSGPNINLNVLISQMKKIATLKANFEILTIPNIKFKDLAAFYSQKTNIFKNNCIIPWLGLNIMPDLKATPGGGVLGCNYVVGDLKRESLKTIWNNLAIREFRENIIKHNLPAPCFRCCHRQYY